MKRSLILYRDFLLPPSEMFIVRMAESFSRYCPYYVGLRRVEGISTPPERTLLFNRGSARCDLQEGLFRYRGWVPRAIRRRLDRVKPALVHAQFGWDAARGMTLAEALQLPLIVHYRGHDATFDDPATRRLSRLSRQYLKRRDKLKASASLFIALSHFLRHKLEEQGFPQEKILVHHTGIDLDFFQPCAGTERQPVVLFAGRLTRYKGCDFLIEAMERVQKTHPELELVIVGDGAMRPDLERLAASHLRRYRFLGWLDQVSLRDWFARARLFAFPSITADWGEAEGLGNVAQEAQAMGLPVVGHIHGGIPEVVRNGQTGILVPERDTAGLAGAILELATDRNLWQSFSIAGQQHVRDNFDLRRRNQLLEKYYDQVLDRTNTHSVTEVGAETAPVGLPAEL